MIPVFYYWNGFKRIKLSACKVLHTKTKTKKFQIKKENEIECFIFYFCSDIMDVKRMMEKLGQAKTHLELKKMIAEVDRTGTGVITYQDFVLMMLGKKSSILKL